jgi:hypothetical protein
MSAIEQPSPGSGELSGVYGKWTDAAIRMLRTIELKDVSFSSGPLGYAVIWNGRPIGRINRYRRHKTMTVKIEGHQFWVEPNPVIPRWHYNPGHVAVSVKEAKSLALKLVADAASLAPNVDG